MLCDFCRKEMHDWANNSLLFSPRGDCHVLWRHEFQKMDTQRDNSGAFR